MKKYIIYSALCLVCAIIIYCVGKNNETEDVSALSNSVVTEDMPVEDVEIVDLASLQDIKELTSKADNILMKYTYALSKDDIMIEVSDISTLYDYTNNKGHVVKLDNMDYCEIWFQDDNYYYMSTPDTDWHYVIDSASLANCEYDASYFRKNLRTVDLLLDVLSSDSNTIVRDTDNYTFYTVCIQKDYVARELLKSDSTADLKSTLFQLRVPKDTSQEFKASIELSYENSNLGISAEKYTYTWQVDTMYNADIPVDIGG